MSEDARQRLLELSGAIQDKVMAQFAPKEGTRDVSTLFMGFAKSIAQNEHTHRGPSRAVDDFVHKWGLNAEAAAMLRDMPADSQHYAMGSFDPGPQTRDISSRFIGFARKKVLSQTQQGSANGSFYQGQKSVQSPLDSFIERWSLNDSAINRLRALPVEQQDEAIQLFSPKANTRDINGKFIAFLRTFQPHQDTAYYRSREVDYRSKEIDAFVQRWGLSQEAAQFLIDLPDELQREAMAKFAPPESTRDMNGKFMSFGRSLIGDRPRKRARYE